MLFVLSLSLSPHSLVLTLPQLHISVNKSRIYCVTEPAALLRTLSPVSMQYILLIKFAFPHNSLPEGKPTNLPRDELAVTAARQL